MPDVAASCTTDQTTFQKCRRKKIMEWILSKKVPVGFFNGLGKFFSCPGSGHAPRPTSQTPGTRPVPCRTPQVWRTWSWRHWLPGHDQCLTLPPAAPPTRPLFKNVAEKNYDMDPLEKCSSQVCHWAGEIFFMSWVGPRPTPHIPDPRDMARAVPHAPHVAHVVVGPLAPRP